MLLLTTHCPAQHISLFLSVKYEEMKTEQSPISLSPSLPVGGIFGNILRPILVIKTLALLSPSVFLYLASTLEKRP